MPPYASDDQTHVHFYANHVQIYIEVKRKKRSKKLKHLAHRTLQAKFPLLFSALRSLSFTDPDVNMISFNSYT